MKATFAVVQDQGQRKRQEDYAAYDPPAGTGVEGAPALIVLADGMGGHAGGNIASRAAVEALMASWRNGNPSAPARARLKSGLNAAIGAIDREVSEHPELDGMGCTLVALEPRHEGLLWVSVGDSPLWLVRDGAVTRLNADHSQARRLRAMAGAGLMSSADVATDPSRNQLLYVLDGNPLEVVDEPWGREPVRHDDVVVLASDGLDVLSAPEIAAACASGADASGIADALLGRVLGKKAPNQDNVTIMVLQISDPASRGGRAARWPGIAAIVGAVSSALALVGLLTLLGYRTPTASTAVPPGPVASGRSAPPAAAGAAAGRRASHPKPQPRSPSLKPSAPAAAAHRARLQPVAKRPAPASAHPRHDDAKREDKSAP